MNVFYVRSVLMLLILFVAACSKDSKSETSMTDTETDSMEPGDTGHIDDTDSDEDTGESEDTGDVDDTGDTEEDKEEDTDDDTDEDTGDSDTGSIPVSLIILEIYPAAVTRALDQWLTLTGAGFVTGMTVDIYLGTQYYELGLAVVSEDGRSASALLPADDTRPQGLYSVVVINPDESSAVLEHQLTISASYPPQVTSVTPALLWAGDPEDGILSDRSIQISGSGFVNTPWVRLVSTDEPDVSFHAVEVNFIDDHTLMVVIPVESAGMVPGTYHVWVTNPDQLAGQWLDSESLDPEVLVVTDTAPPMIHQISPVKWPFNSTCDPFVITGQYFQPDVTAFIVTADGDQELTVITATPTEIRTVLPAGLLTTGMYPIRVTNPDGQFDLFYAFEARSPTDGHFTGNFETVSNGLILPRERLAVAVGFDDRGGTHLYATGGLDREKTVLANTEIVGINIFGEVGVWRTATQWYGMDEPRGDNRFVRPRNGHALLRSGRFLYAIGGTSGDTATLLDEELPALDSVERAHLLGWDTAPDITALRRVGDGDLPTGTWYYRVSALGPWGEGLASREIQILNRGGSLELEFLAVPGATGYNVYRSVAADGRPGTGRWIATLDASETTFIDDGLVFPAPGFLSASVAEGGELAEGMWVYQVSATVEGEESHAGYRVPVTVDTDHRTVILRWSAIPGATYQVYRTLTAEPSLVGSEPTWLLVSDIEDTEWMDDGTVEPSIQIGAWNGIPPLPIGSLSLWTEETERMTVPREGPGVTAVRIEDTTYLIAAGGRLHGGGADYLDTVEYTSLMSDGALNPWTVSTDVLQTPRAFLALVSTQPSGSSPFNPDPMSMSEDEPVFLIAVAGDDLFSLSGVNRGLSSIEAARFSPTQDRMGPWVIQTANLSAGRATYAAGAAVIDSYLYAFPGVDQERTGLDAQDVPYEPVPLTSVSTRFEIIFDDPLPDAPDSLLTGFMSSNGGFGVPRSYYGVARANSHLYLVGGNDGTGAIGMVERMAQ